MTHNGITLHENPYTAPDADSDHEENNCNKDLASEQNNGIYEQLFENSRTDRISQGRTCT